MFALPVQAGHARSWEPALSIRTSHRLGTFTISLVLVLHSTRLVLGRSS